MLINLSNHPSSSWQKEQMQKAEETYGMVVDLPFPQVDPSGNESYIASLANKYFQNCLEIFEKQAGIERKAVHIMGELNLTYSLVNLLQQHGISCIASTTKRSVFNKDNGDKVSAFSFVRFREYKSINKNQPL